MAIANYAKFHQFKERIQSIPASFSDDYLINDHFLLEKDEKKKIEIYYAPFEYVNEEAKVVIVGITPGLHQMKKSFSTVIDAAGTEFNDEEILRQVKNNSSFEGTMRKNLVKMLDELGLNEYLGLSSSIELFEEASHLVHTSSVLPYPVFYNGKNYSGSTPNLLKNEVLKKYVTDYFATELYNLDNPLIIPLGVNVSNALTYLADQGIVERNCILSGFPHPSGGNGHRHKQFAENKEAMQEKLKEHFLQQSLI
ncbi:uracil-DNA glycosylase family protein [Planococcus shixiaomingii]|uniref:uracil-DNA glycosylase family protein n=1 Tax=Planococcus shixiaomingii TaxID=3058393 RepID=UPI00260C5952|nr:uracil-DNA glycosylase family protein [Planococcus sp. N022]WKA53170.1 hypothetical protein QWY21_10905 [Planococcus sp. N022]